MSWSNSNALTLISSYSSSDEDEEKDASFSIEYTQEKNERLPLPDFFKVRLDGPESQLYNNPKLHEGRIRSFPHERGNWASYIFVPYVGSNSFDLLCEAILNECGVIGKIHPIQNPHISLTKTFVMLHHWINPLVQLIQCSLKPMCSFQVEFDKVGIYCNEENTRTFLSLIVSAGTSNLLRSVSILRQCLKEYNLDPFYEEPSFHMSIGWCLGDLRSDLESTASAIQTVLKEFTKSYSEALSFKVNQLVCKTGHRVYNFDLSG